MTEYLQKYNEIMHKYRSGQFGDSNLTLNDVLKISGEDDLFDKMDAQDIQYLIDNSNGIAKMMYLGILKDKLLNNSNDVCKMKTKQKKL